MKEWFKKITGIKKLEEEKQRAEAEKEEALARAQAAREQEELAKLSPKERATKKGEPWVAVLDTKVNKDNVRNGFFELDWNDEFVNMLKQNGYKGASEEEIVDRWFKDLARNVLADEGQDINRGAGFINVNKLAGGKAEVK